MGLRQKHPPIRPVRVWEHERLYPFVYDMVMTTFRGWNDDADWYWDAWWTKKDR